MEPSKQSRGGKDLFRERLDAIIDLKHPLVRLTGLVPWSGFDQPLGRFYKPLCRPAGEGDAADGRAALPETRL
jgi:transposase, IS5 family